MLWKELHDQIGNALGQFVSNVRWTPAQTMQWLSEAQSRLQHEARLMERVDTITIPANTSPVNYSFRWEPTQARVRDDVNKIDYALRGYDQFRISEDHLTPTVTPSRITPPYPTPLMEPSKYVCTFFNRQFYVYPVPTVNTVLTVHYVPLLPLYSSVDPYWAAWFASDASFWTQFTTLTPEREFFPHLNGMVEYAVSKYLLPHVASKEVMPRYTIARQEWMDTIKYAKITKPIHHHAMQPTYVDPV